MSRKAPKNYGRKNVQRTTATPEEERQARRWVIGIALGIGVIMGLIILGYYLAS